MDDFNATDSEVVDGVVRQVVVDGVGECFALGRVEFFNFRSGVGESGVERGFSFAYVLFLTFFAGY